MERSRIRKDLRELLLPIHRHKQNKILTVTLVVRVRFYNKHTAEKGGYRWILMLPLKVTNKE